MSKWLKLTIALVIAISTVTVATALANTIYMPMVFKNPTATPTMTFTPTVTGTKITILFIKRFLQPDFLFNMQIFFKYRLDKIRNIMIAF